MAYVEKVSINISCSGFVIGLPLQFNVTFLPFLPIGKLVFQVQFLVTATFVHCQKRGNQYRNFVIYIHGHCCFPANFYSSYSGGFRDNCSHILFTSAFIFSSNAKNKFRINLRISKDLAWLRHPLNVTESNCSVIELNRTISLVFEHNRTQKLYDSSMAFDF